MNKCLEFSPVFNLTVLVLLRTILVVNPGGFSYLNYTKPLSCVVIFVISIAHL